MYFMSSSRDSVSALTVLSNTVLRIRQPWGENLEDPLSCRSRKKPGLSRRHTDHNQPGEWSVVLPLWTREEDISDLSMEATVSESPDGASVIIDNIHVL
jgi:hypothetical protein